jgi:hypothetical protein
MYLLAFACYGSIAVGKYCNEGFELNWIELNCTHVIPLFIVIKFLVSWAYFALMNVNIPYFSLVTVI